jgi:GT2 family glycosyltransferase
LAAGWSNFAREYQKLNEELRKQHSAGMPLYKISIVSVLHNKSKEIFYFLEALMQQTYKGQFEIIFVDDTSSDGSAEIAQNCFDEAKRKNESEHIPELAIIKNDKNMGNCHSRNRGISNAGGDIIVVIDSDCIVNKDFLSSHAYAHMLDDCEVVVGPMNIESDGEDPFDLLNSYESFPEKIISESQMQDPINTQSFLNCVTRNFSIKKRFINGELFDPLFSYSKDPLSGFGWEDVEMGYRLYKRGARIKFIPNAVSIHLTHLPGVAENIKAVKSLLNFRRLFEKHPELSLVARRWAIDTYQKICDGIDRERLINDENKAYLDNLFQRFIPYPFHIGNHRKLKILTYRWHCPHQYELYKLPYEYTLAQGVGTSFTDLWEYEQRPLHSNVGFRPIEGINVRDYDLAIMHFDENVLATENTNGVIPREWGANFKWFRENLDLPKIAICHGTPQFYGQYTSNNSGADTVKIIEEEWQRMVNYLGDDVLVICNSHQAQAEWRFKNSKVIWHGFDPTEFPPSRYEDGILTLGSAMKERPHYRGYYVFRKVFDNFPDEFSPHALSVPEPHEVYKINTNSYAYAKFRNYIDEIRKYSVYFNPTIRSPMPRSRGEAMMCGLVIVSTNNHDVDLFLKNGVNGFYSNDPDELREHLLYLLKNPSLCRKIGMEGRKTAMDIFNHDRYLKEWENTINSL